jgi:hypothetical protein
VLQILAGPFRQEGRSWKYVLAFAVLATIALVVMAPHGRDKVSMIMAMVWCVVLFGWLVMSILRQNHPFAARLVPGHVRRLKRVLLGAWATATLLVLGGLVFATGLNPWALALAAGAGCCFVALGMRWWPIWIVMWLGPMLVGLPSLKALTGSVVSASVAAWQAQPELATLAGLLLSALLLPTMIGRGGHAHITWYQRQTQMREQMRTGGGVKGLEQFGRLGEKLERPFQRVSGLWLGRTLRLAQPTAASAMSRLEIALHGRQHWVRALMGAVLGIAAVAAIFGMLGLFTGGNVDMRAAWKGGAAGLSFGLISILLAPVTAAVNMLWFTRREQALLTLLPGVPQGTQLNGWVLWIHARRVLWIWGPGLAGFWWLAKAAEQPALLTMPFTTLPIFTLLLLQSPARFTGGQAAMLLPGLAWMVATGLGLGLVGTDLVSVGTLCTASLALTAVLIVWRYPRLMHGPVSLPAGRCR